MATATENQFATPAKERTKQIRSESWSKNFSTGVVYLVVVGLLAIVGFNVINGRPPGNSEILSLIALAILAMFKDPISNGARSLVEAIARTDSGDSTAQR